LDGFTDMKKNKKKSAKQAFGDHWMDLQEKKIGETSFRRIAVHPIVNNPITAVNLNSYLIK
jgi:hypothetical protein